MFDGDRAIAAPQLLLVLPSPLPGNKVPCHRVLITEEGESFVLVSVRMRRPGAGCVCSLLMGGFQEKRRYR